MLIHLIAVGNRMPKWIEQGYDEYAKRMPAECRLKLVEISASKRSKNSDMPRLIRQEGKKMLAAIPKNTKVVALEVEGKLYSTEQLVNELKSWQQSGQDIALLIGGSEGLATECLAKATTTWSLSRLTLPHPLVRVILAEQLYRATTILKGHPYHK